MKKLVAAFIGLITVGISAMTVSAQDYEVREGDSLWTIAVNNNTTVEALIDINELNTTLIYPKQILKLDKQEAEYYIVQQGDTLSHISGTHTENIPVEHLKAWNNLSSDLIIAGQKLILNDANTVEIKSAGQSTDEESEEKIIETSENTDKTNPEVSEKTPEVETAEATVQKTEEKAETEPQETTEKANGKTFSVESTAYTASCSGCSGVTATGINLNNDPNAKVIAVDPNVIPLGTEVYVEDYGYAVAGDTGGAIKGNKIDIHVPTKSEAYNWGRRTVEITIVE